MRYFKFKGVLQKDQWLSPAYVGVDDGGTIKYFSSIAPPDPISFEYVDGLAVPGFMNAHSHAFQYGMSGLAEEHSAVHDDFWTWREAMYQCALSVAPDDAEAIAGMLYIEMLRHGYTHVAEFHYLHHDKNGRPYDQLELMGEKMIAAAVTAGINITLVPVFYQKGGFGLEPQARQKRFISKTVDEYFELLDASKNAILNYSGAKLGWSVHSLRAVEAADIVKTFEQGPKDLPFHLHIAEQKKEVEDCIAYTKLRPFQWLHDNLPVDRRFNLVHATHLDDQEVKDLAASGAHVVLCPSTEGNLGDGIFRMKEFVSLKGRWTIGTDSHIGLNPLEEFRMIDYRQRLITHERNTFRGNAAGYMIDESITTGQAAMTLNSPGHFNIGTKFDAAVYDAAQPLISSSSQKNWLSTIVYASNETKLLGTIINGNWVIKNGRHQLDETVKLKFGRAIRNISNR